MDFDPGKEAEEFRQEVRDFIAEHLTDQIREEMERTGNIYDASFQRAMGEKGWIAPGWPPEEGGAGKDWVAQHILSEEMRRAWAPTDGVGITMLVASTLRIWGTPQQKTEILPRAVRGEIVICLGYSEPGGGSDVAGARTRAVRDGEEWVINGEKMFTTLAHVSDYVFLVTRTNTEVKKHLGLTMFLVPMDTPGITISEVKTLGGERTNITSYQDVRVPSSAIVGEVDGGWRVLMSALELERAVSFAAEIDHLCQSALELARQSGRLSDPVVRNALARAAIDAEVSSLLGWNAAYLASTGSTPVVEGPMAKLYSSESFTRAAASLLDLFGADGLANGELEHAFRHSQVTRIYAGTSEIQRSIIAERGLGLPRTRAKG
jgi:alkylation response protein AidB-like acyl-CoA dehydrogenase